MAHWLWPIGVDSTIMDQVSRKRKGERKRDGSGSPTQKVAASAAMRSGFAVSPEEVILGLLVLSLAVVFDRELWFCFTLPKLLCLRIYTLLLVLLWVYRFSKGEIRHIPKMVLYPVLALAGWWIFATCFAFHVPTALNGASGRYNGLYTYLTYVFLFLVIATLPAALLRVERILKTVTVILIPVALYAFVQRYGLDPLFGYQLRPISSVGNAVTLAALLGLAVPFSLSFVFNATGVYARIWWMVVFLVLFLGATITLSRGPIVGITVSLLIVAFVYVRQMSVKKATLSLLFAGCVVFIITWTNVGRLGDLLDRFRPTARMKADEAVQVRLFIYKGVLAMIRSHPVAGVGFENLRGIYPQYRPIEEIQAGRAKDIIPTMVHNGYLQMASETGIPSLVLYLTFIASVFALIIRRYRASSNEKARSYSMAFLASIAGYLVQDLSGWPEVGLAASFWVILGLGVALGSGGVPRIVPGRQGRIVGFTMAGVVALGLLYVSVSTAHTIYGDKLIWKSYFRLNFTSDWPQAESNIAQGLNQVGGDYYYEDLAGMAYINRFLATGDLDMYRKAQELFQEAFSHNPYHGYTLIHAMDLDSFALQKGRIFHPSLFVESSVARLKSLDPHNPRVYFTIAKLRMYEKRYGDAIDLLEMARGLEPTEFEYYVLETEAYQAAGRIGDGIGKYRTALSLRNAGSQPLAAWLSSKQILAMLLTAQKAFDPALAEIEDAIRKSPENVISYLVRGAIFAGMKRFEDARASFEIALKKEPSNAYAVQGLERVKRMSGKG